MRRAATENETFEVGGQARPRARSVLARKARLRRLAMDSLENRTLLATLPAATYATSLAAIVNAGPNDNNSSPQIAIDRYDASKLVAVWVNTDPTDRPQTPQVVEAAYSVDGGKSWTLDSSLVPAIQLDANSSPMSPLPYSNTTDPTVGFDAQNRVYVLVDQHSGAFASGMIAIAMSDFGGSSPSFRTFNDVYHWANNIGAAYTPDLGVDDNVASFTDPTTKAVQTDASSNNLYVTYVNNDPPPPAPLTPANYNPWSVRVVASSDQGVTWTNDQIVNEAGQSYQHVGTDSNAAPKLTISQGTATAPGGQVTLVWDDWGDFTHVSPNADLIQSATVTSGTADAFTSPDVPGVINPAVGNPLSPVITDFSIDVNITDPAFTTISSLTTTLGMLEPSLNMIGAVLIGPNGQQITLFKPRLNSNAPFFGISGSNMGGTNLGLIYGTTFDDNASQNINQGASPYTGHYRPELGSMLGPFVGFTPTGNGDPSRALNGTWTLEITNFAGAVTPSPALLSWTLSFTSGSLMKGGDKTIGRTPVHGAATGNFALASPSSPVGIGPAPVIVANNTLGSFSPNEGSIYVAYVTQDGTPGNPALNTDIALVVSKDGGTTWQPLTNKINDDNGATDGSSGAVNLTGIEVNGRSQYMPALAVDSVTGTLVASWRDARNDVSNARVATYITTSLDGGRTFSPDVFANNSQTATDTITGNTVVYGPIPDNESSAASPDPFGYGPDMGLVAYDGQIIPVWAGNSNKNAGPLTTPAKLGIFSRVLETAAGPRIINSTMGPVGGPGDTVNTAVGPDGTPKPTHIQVTFDRPVDPNTFKVDPITKASDVEVFYKGTTANTAFVPLLVTGVTPISSNQFGATQFQITFDPTKKADGTARATPIDFTGTYSYLIKPNISDRIRSLVLPQVAQAPIVQSSGPINLPFTSQDGEVSSTINVGGIPSNQIIQSISVNLSITDNRDGDLTIVLVSPNGDQSTLYQNGNDNGQNFTNTTFTDGASSIFGGVAPYSGTFSPVTQLNALAGHPVLGTYTLEIFASGTSNSGVLKNWSITINSYAPSSGAQLSTGNRMDQNADSTTGQDVTVTPFTGLAPGDDYLVPTPAPTVPVVFDLRPGSGHLFPNPPYNQQTLGLIVSGPRLASTTLASPGYQPGSSSGLVLNSTASSIDVAFDRDINPNTVTPASVLRIMGPAGLITGPQTYTLPVANQNQTIPSGTGVPLTSTITVPVDNGTFALSHLAVALDMSVIQDSALTVFLIAPNGSKIQLFSGLQGSNFTKTVLDDSGVTPISSGVAPYTGVFQPLNSLQSFIQPQGVPMDLAPSKTQNTWTLQVLNAKQGNVGKLISWSLIATPTISITPNPKGTDPNPASPRTYRINFPQQSLSGTYTVQLASTITSAAGDALDTDLNAGIEVFNGGGTSVATTPISYGATGLPLTVPNATLVGPTTIPGNLLSTINVPDNFTVQGQTAAGLAGLTVQLNISGSLDPNFEATLIYHLGQADQVTVPLFNFDNLSPVGKVGTNQGAGFQNTVFTDLSPTAIQIGGPPFFATTGYRSENPLLSSSSYTDAQGNVHFTPGFKGLNVGGAWTLSVSNVSTLGTAGHLNSWSLTFQKPLPSSGLGEPVADQASTSFRIFTMDPTNPLSSDTWTAVGPASINSSGGGPESAVGGSSGRIGGIAVDKSDPSGNTVYIGGASGGIWKTTNFLSPTGPTWIPLTNFGPTFSLNIGSIAVFPRNNDTRQSIIIAATGEGDTGSTGVGFLISKDGGATWNLYDSTNNVSSIIANNVNSNANILPISSTLRDHVFVGDSAFKVLVDPLPTPTGQVIIYAALSGPTGGIWRSQNTGQTWQLMRGGQATDVAMDFSSGTGAPGGNLQIIYGAFRGDGVYISPNQGQVWNLMAGGIGNPNLVNSLTQKNINPNTQPNPNGAQGRIELVTPEPTGNAVQDDIYQEWLYAVVITPSSHLSGLYVTKDFGANWTKVRIPTLPPVAANGKSLVEAVPTNDINQNDWDIGGGPPGTGLPAQGNYDVSLAIDPTNPAVVYLGGTADGQSTGFLRIDTTNLWDAHSLAAYDNNGITGGSPITVQSSGPMTVSDPTKAVPAGNAFTNVIGFSDGYIGQQFFFNGGGLANNGAGVKWIPFDIGGTDQHRIVTEIDPVTHLPRIIIGDDQGLFTAVDKNGTFFSGIGTATTTPGSRNGNLQITQFYYGAAQPNNVALAVQAALFYGSAQDNGGPGADPNLLNNGNLVWTGPGGDAGGVATDQTGSGTFYQFFWPCCGGGDTQFFQVNGVPQTDGLLQASNGLPTPDPQWPSTFGANFAVNPINGNQVAMSSTVGRIFRTETAEQTTVNWFEIGNPAALDSTYAPAIAFGAPDPNSPAGIGNLDNFIYAGTTGGHVFMTQVGGGANGNTWANISTGLDGSSLQQIITDPVRGSHDAYAVTAAGVYYVPDSVALANAVAAAAAGGPAVPAAVAWQNITGNLFSLMHNGFNNTDFSQVIAHGLSSIQADWRYAIPNNPTQTAGPNTPSHPVLYVGGNAGTFRSLDFGKTWTIYPNIAADASPVDGGYLPSAQVTSLSISTGAIDINTGRAILKPGDPNLLLASTYGSGFYAIRLAPLVFSDSVQLSTTRPAPAGSNGGVGPDGLPLVTVPQPVINGVGEQSAFGNSAFVSLYDLTDPNNPKFIGGFDGTPGDATAITANQTDAYGNFSVQVNPNAFTTNGDKTIGIQATDSSGTKGNMVQFSFNYQAAGASQTQPPTTPTLSLAATSDSSNGLNITNDNTPQFIGTTDPSVTVTLVDSNGNPISGFSPVTTNQLTGAFSLQYSGTGLPDGVYTVRAKATNTNGSSFSTPLVVTIKTTGPASNTFQGLSLASDTGIPGDNITDVRQPVFIGTTVPNNTGNASNDTQVDLLQVTSSGTVVLATVTAAPNGSYSVQLPSNLNNGQITLETRVHDVAGNFGPTSSQVTVTINSTLADYNLDAKTELALFRRTSAAQGTWLIQGVTTAGGLAFGTGGVVPFAGDFNGDGVNDLAYYNTSTHTWFIEDSQGTNLQPGTPPNPPVQIPLGVAGGTPIVGDFTGSGTSEVGFYTPGANGTTSIWQVAGSNGLQTTSFGQAGDIPVPGHYDAQGHDELAVYRPSTGQILVLADDSNPAKPVINTFNIGTPNLVPVPGDYDNIAYFKSGKAEPKTEPGVFNPNTGLMTITGPTGTYTVQFNKGDIPASGDYDNIGETEPAVFRPSTSQFVIYNPITKAFRSVAFGTSTDIPVLAPYSYRLALSKATITPTIALSGADDSSKGLGITNVTKPHFVGKTDPNAQVDLINAATGTVLGTGTADASGNYSVAPATALTDGTYTFQTRAYGFGGDVGIKSATLKVTIQTKLSVISITPANSTAPLTGTYPSLPSGQIVITFNHAIAGLNANDPTGGGFSKFPFAVFLVPRGPGGAFAAPTGLDAGSTPLHATLVYAVNANGTSTITLTPQEPLGTDIYLVAVSGALRDLAGNPLLNANAVPGTHYSTFELQTTHQNPTPLTVTSVTTLHASVNIANNTIPQPDTIAIGFSKPVNFLTVNTSTVQLIGPGNTVIKAAVAYSPTTRAVYLTPEDVLVPNTTYTVRVASSVTDDQGFPNPDTAFTLGKTFTTTFKVSSAGATGTSPLQVVKNNGQVAISPGPGTRTSPFGYASIPFTEAIDMNALGRFSVMLSLAAGGLNNTGFDAADAALNSKLAFNPNTNTLILVPTVPLSSGDYLYTLNNIKAANNSDKLGGTPIYVGFKVRLPSNSPAVLVSHQSQTAAEFTVASAATTTTTGVAITPSISTNQVNSGSTSFSTGRSRPAQATAHDQILGGFNIRSFFSTRRGQQVLTNLERLADERAGDN